MITICQQRGSLKKFQAAYTAAKIKFNRRPDIIALTHLWRCFGNCEPFWSEEEWTKEREIMAQAREKAKL